LTYNTLAEKQTVLPRISSAALEGTIHIPGKLLTRCISFASYLIVGHLQV